MKKRIVSVTVLIHVEKLREQVEELSQSAPLFYMISSSLKNEKGKNIGRRSGINHSKGDSEKESKEEKAIKLEMYRIALEGYELKAHAFIEPCRKQIIWEHQVRVQDFYPFVVDNPFIPPGREKIYAEGLHAGLYGDFLVSTHVLPPQIENSVRYILQNHGVIVSKIDDNGIQDERDINDLVHEPKLEELLGKDIVFALKGLLVERFGSNIRNNMAHGLISHDGFYVGQCSYLWWLVLRICFDTPHG